MNYIWELAILAAKKGIDINNINFIFGEPFSAYMELSFEDINETNVLLDVEINPYYRYYSIFKELFEPNNIELEQFRDVLLDILIHHLIDIDVLMGLSRREYYIFFVIEDMFKGYFGEFVKHKAKILTEYELKIIANNILRLYSSGEAVFLLKETVRSIFKKAYIFSNNMERDEIIIYIREKETKVKSEKLSVIKYFFLPFKYELLIYWENIFGIIGYEEFMKIGDILNF